MIRFNTLKIDVRGTFYNVGAAAKNFFLRLSVVGFGHYTWVLVFVSAKS